MGRLVAYIGHTVLIRSRKNTSFAIDHYNGNGMGDMHDSVIYSVGGENANRKYVIDNKGRITLAAYRNKCLIRNGSNNRVNPVDYTTLAEDDQRQYWGMNSLGQIHAQDNANVILEVASGSMWNDRYVCTNAGINRADNCDKWNIESAGDTELVIKRGVMDANGVIYKLTSIADNALVDMAAYTKVTFPHHNLRQFTTFRNSLPRGALEIKWRDTWGLKKIGDTCKRWLFRYIAPTGYFYINCVSKIVRSTSDFTEFVDIRVGNETQINDLIKIGNDMWVVCESARIYKLNADWSTFTQYTATNIATVNCIMNVNNTYYICGKATAGSTTSGAVCRSTNLTAWTRVFTSGSELHSLAYYSGGPTYVATSSTVTSSAVAKCHKSINGTDWSSAYTVTWGINMIGETYTRVPTTFSTGQNRFVLATGNGIWLEQTGNGFITELVTATQNMYFNGVCIYNGRCMPYGENGKFMSVNNDYVASSLTFRTMPAGKTTTNLRYYTHTADYGAIAGNGSTFLYCKNQASQSTWVDESPPYDVGNFVDITVMNHRWTLLSDRGYVYTKWTNPA